MMSQGIGWQDQLRQFLRVRLGARRYRALGVVRHRLVEMPHRPAILLAQMLPAATRVRVREAIQVVEKLDYAPRDVWLHVDSTIEHHVRRFSCAKEPDTVQWIETAFRAGEVFYDVGANVGAYSLVAWAFFRGHISVYAFEPAVVNYIQLCRNLVLNRCQHLIVPLPVALSRKTAVDTFHYQTLEPGGALHALGAAIDHQGMPLRPFGPSRSWPIGWTSLLNDSAFPRQITSRSTWTGRNSRCCVEQSRRWHKRPSGASWSSYAPELGRGRTRSGRSPKRDFSCTRTFSSLEGSPTTSSTDRPQEHGERRRGRHTAKLLGIEMGWEMVCTARCTRLSTGMTSWRQGNGVCG